MKNAINQNKRNAERGGAGVKLLIAGVILFLIGHAGYQYIPTAYTGQDFKQDMEAAVVRGATMPISQGKPVDLVKQKLTQTANKHGIPQDRFIDVKENGGVVNARVYYKVDVPILPFGVYNYQYVFDHTATPSGFSTK